MAFQSAALGALVRQPVLELREIRTRVPEEETRIPPPRGGRIQSGRCLLCIACVGEGAGLPQTLHSKIKIPAPLLVSDNVCPSQSF